MKHSMDFMAGNDFAAHTEQLREKLVHALGFVDRLAPLPGRRFAQPRTEARVRQVLKVRRSRAKFLDGKLFADPAWDILLELYAAELGQRRVSVSSLCLGAAVPATTALRWITALERKGMIQRTNDPMDGRRVFVSMSDGTIEAMANFFETVPEGETVI